MSFMTSLAAVIKEPSKYKREIKMVFIAVIITLLIFTLLNGNDKLRVFVILISALYLFSTEKLPAELTALCIMVILMIFGIVSPAEGVSGFSNSATITVLSMFILSAGVQKTGIINKLGNYMFRFAGNDELKLILAISLIVGPISGFINSTAAVAIMLPMVLDISKKAKISPAKLLIPLSFVSMAGGMLTLIGSSTNILASGMLKEFGFPEISMFEFTGVGMIILLSTIAFFAFFGRFLLPNRENGEMDLAKNKECEFLAEILIEKNSHLIGKSLKESGFLQKYNAKIIKIIRGENSFIKDAEDMKVQESDIVILKIDEQKLVSLDKEDPKEGVKILLDFDENKRRFAAGTGEIIKIVARSFNMLHKRTLAESNIFNKINAAVIGIHREDVSERRLGSTVLNTGEIFLVKAGKLALNEITNSNSFVIIQSLQKEFDPEKMWLALGIVAAVVVFAALGVMPIMVSALAGVVLMILTKCVDFESIHNYVNWNVFFLLAGVIPLGIAMDKSGLAASVATIILYLANFLPAIIVLGIFSLFTLLLTSIISNNASVVLLVPVAISVAEKLNMNPLAFVLAVMFASSMSFLTPVGYQTNAMIFSAGNYKFRDFIKVGAPLSILLVVISTILIVKFWGL